MKIVFICSTNASVIKHALQSGFLNNLDIEFVSDRNCGAIEFAKKQGFRYKVLLAKSGKEFSSLLSEIYNDTQNTLFISFYTRLLTGSFLDMHRDNLINFHPSILPACPGMNGFSDTIKSGAMFIGSTVHFVDSGVDTGCPIIQGSFPRDSNAVLENLRHRVFLQQVISLIQIVNWFNAGRVKRKDTHCYVLDAEYKLSEFSPNLDSNLKDLYFSWLKSNF